MWVMTDDPRKDLNEPTDIAIHFEKGIPVKLVTLQGEHTDSVDLFRTLNKIGKIHGIGRIDIVENRFIGLKSRGCCSRTWTSRDWFSTARSGRSEISL